LPDGRVDRCFDTDRNGRIDYVERQAADGVVVLLRFDADEDGKFELEAPPPSLVSGDVRHLIIILDSIPYGMVRDLWNHGRFRHFHPPSRVISPFPVMTDMCIAEFFGVSPTPAVESQYYDGRRLNTGYGTYAREENSQHWLDKTDYHLAFATHSIAYFRPDAWFDHELRRIQELFIKYDENPFIAYAVGTSGLGAQLGRDGHLTALVRLDRFCQWIIHRMKGRVHITLLSDHGHNMMSSRWIDLTGILRRCGYRVRRRLERPGDVVVPEFGIVTCAAVHTAEPAAVASDLSGVEGVDLAAYRDENGDVIVVGRNGRARIWRRGDRYRYQPVHGDPLRLVPIRHELEQRGEIDGDGFVDDGALFEATTEHEYPDVVHRLWRAFHGLIQHTPDVLLSIEDGYHCGSKFMTELISLRAAHGNLNTLGSSGFVMSTAGRVDPVIRMEDLGGALRALGVRISVASPLVGDVVIRGAPPLVGRGRDRTRARAPVGGGFPAR